MPIKAITGTPGAGKTLRALQELLTEAGVKDQSSPAAIAQGLQACNRPLVVCGVEGLVAGYFREIENPMDWQDLEDGSIVLVDEAWKWWGKHLAHIRTDPRYLALAEHRHRGFDFIITTQSPTQLQDHLRGLVGEHLHVTRKFGTSHTMCYQWPALQESPNGKSIKKEAIETHWKHPAGLYSLYKSATQHTIKRKFPKRILLIPVALLCVVGLAAVAAKSITSLGNDVVPGARAAEGEQASGAVSGKDKEPMSAEAWVKRFEPRFPEVPMSAPAYDAREVVAEPRIACMIGERTGCKCKTEQGTDYTIPQARCRKVVAAAGVYDPFKPPTQAVAPRAADSRPSVDASTSHNGDLRAPFGSSAEPVPSYGGFQAQAAGAPLGPPSGP